MDVGCLVLFMSLPRCRGTTTSSPSSSCITWSEISAYKHAAIRTLMFGTAFDCKGCSQAPTESASDSGVGAGLGAEPTPDVNADRVSRLPSCMRHT